MKKKTPETSGENLINIRDRPIKKTSTQAIPNVALIANPGTTKRKLHMKRDACLRLEFGIHGKQKHFTREFPVDLHKESSLKLSFNKQIYSSSI